MIQVPIGNAMANPEHMSILEKGGKAWNEWRQDHPEIRPDLSEGWFHSADMHGWNFQYANLSRANFVRAHLGSHTIEGPEPNLVSASNFRGADLSRANLSQAYLYEANLSGANLEEADLTGANLSRTDLSSANLSGADLNSASLSQANLSKVNLTDANLAWAHLVEATLSEANLTNASLSFAHLIKTNLSKAILCDCHVYGTSVWLSNLEGATQSNLIITDSREPTITADNLEVAQFLYLLLNSQRMRDIIDTITTKVVLILGRFTEERKIVLDAIRDQLRRNNYLPVLFDFDKPASRDTHETITTLARLAFFVIADITEPKSIPQELVSIVESLPSLAIQPILQYGNEPWGMYDHISRYPWVLPPYTYTKLGDLLESLMERVIKPAAKKAMALRSTK
jgi:uncharacterized protein YjbI with pentapeptide repeats